MTTRNDPRQYDTLADRWWEVNGPFAMLHWMAKARCELIPVRSTADTTGWLVDIGCGGGLNASHIHGYHHIGIDIRLANLRQARQYDVSCAAGDATLLPLSNNSADVVIAGEILEHVPDWPAAIAEACRVLKPGGTLIIDTLAATALSRFVAITLAERLPGGPPPGIHDPELFIKPADLVTECAKHGVDMRVWGFRPAAGAMLRWLIRRRGEVPMVRVRSKSILYAGSGVKNA